MALKKVLTAVMCLVLLTACSLPQSTPAVPPSPTFFVLPTFPLATPTVVTPTPSLPTAAFVTVAPSTLAVTTPLPGLVTSGVTPVSPAAFCADTAPQALIANLQSALQSSNGPALAALVSPVSGMEASRYRYGRTVTYDQRHAQFLFISTFQVKWGPAPGSGQQTVGAFHQVVLPAWLRVFNNSYSLSCNTLQVGGTTYNAEWLYPGVNYYSVHFPGTSANGNMDWATVVVGMQNVNGKYYIQAVMFFEWEI